MAAQSGEFCLVSSKHKQTEGEQKKGDKYKEGRGEVLFAGPIRV